MFVFNLRNGLLQEMKAAEAAVMLGVHVDRLHYAARKQTKTKSGMYVFHARPNRTTLNRLYAAETFDGEVWSRFRDTHYYASNVGRIKRIAGGQEYFIRPSYNKTRVQVFLYYGGKEYTFDLKRVIAEVFGILPDAGQEWLVQINADFTDCSAMNLKWVEKTKYAKKVNGRQTQKALVWLNEHDEVIEYFQSATEAAKVLPLDRSTVCRYCNGKTKKPTLRLMWEEDYEKKCEVNKGDFYASALY